MDLSVVNHQDYFAKIGDDHKFPINKFGELANYLIKKGFNAEILDAEAENLTHEQTAEKIAKKKPRLAVFMVYGQQPSASTQCMPGGKKTCLKLNEISANEIKSIVIGTHASALPKKTLEEEPYTYVCQGEGPITVIELINFLKGSRFYSLNSF